MSIDERLAELKGKHDLLTDRHNALVESIELWIMENRDRDVKLSQMFSESSKRMNESDKRMIDFDARLDKLLQVAQFHDHRLNSHNDRLDDLEGAS